MYFRFTYRNYIFVFPRSFFLCVQPLLSLPLLASSYFIFLFNLVSPAYIWIICTHYCGITCSHVSSRFWVCATIWDTDYFSTESHSLPHVLLHSTVPRYLKSSYSVFRGYVWLLASSLGTLYTRHCVFLWSISSAESLFATSFVLFSSLVITFTSFVYCNDSLFHLCNLLIQFSLILCVKIWSASAAFWSLPSHLAP